MYVFEIPHTLIQSGTQGQQSWLCPASAGALEALRCLSQLTVCWVQVDSAKLNLSWKSLPSVCKMEFSAALLPDLFRKPFLTARYSFVSIGHQLDHFLNKKHSSLMNKWIYNETSTAIIFFSYPILSSGKTHPHFNAFPKKVESTISWNRYFNGKYQTTLMKNRNISSAFNTPRYLRVLLTSFEKRVETIKQEFASNRNWCWSAFGAAFSLSYCTKIIRKTTWQFSDICWRQLHIG